MANELNPKALAYTLGILGLIDGFIHGLFMMAGTEFLWWNNGIWNLYYANLPGISIGFGGAVMAALWCGIPSAILGWIFGWLYNKASTW